MKNFSEYLIESQEFASSIISNKLGFTNPSTIRNFGSFMIVRGFKTYVAISSKNIFKIMSQEQQYQKLFSGYKNIINFIKLRRESKQIKMHNNLYFKERDDITESYPELMNSIKSRDPKLVKMFLYKNTNKIKDKKKVMRVIVNSSIDNFGEPPIAYNGVGNKVYNFLREAIGKDLTDSLSSIVILTLNKELQKYSKADDLEGVNSQDDIDSKEDISKEEDSKKQEK